MGKLTDPAAVPQPDPENLGFAYLVRRLRELSGFDLSHYKPDQIQRRTRYWMETHGIGSLALLVRRLQRDPQACHEFINFLAVNTSHFFRDPSVFEALKETVLPELLERHGRLRIWSAGCSIGAEPYSLAILLDLGGRLAGQHLLATDVDEEALAVARAGVYQEHHLVNVPPELRQRYFQPAGSNRWQLVQHLREAVRFRRHDLLADPCEAGFQLILCRHVLIYLTPEAQQRLLQRLTGALAPGGYLVVGGPESILEPHQVKLERTHPCVYRCTGPHPIPAAPPR